MKRFDIEYLCRTIGNLAGMPIRIFKNNEQIFYYSVVFIPKDPINIYREQIFKITDHIGYFYTDDFHYYGIINSEDIKIVVGPSSQLPDSEQELRQLAFRTDVPADETEDFISGIKCIVKMPIESTLQMLCTLNYVLNGEKKTLEDITITSHAQIENKNISVNCEPETLFSDENTLSDSSLHNTYDLEQTIMNMIRRGESAALQEWTANAPAVRSGILAPDRLRQQKNTFIVSATLSSRAAIRGGLSIDEAFTLSDAYIQRCELLKSPDEITNLQYRMIIDFTDRVNRIRHGGTPTPLVLEVSNYIRHHMSESITTEAISKSLHMSRSHLSRKFKSESGENLTDYMVKEKLAEAKRLLRYTDKSLSAISLYLGFSSQSHFSRVFRKYSELSPSEYRLKYAL